MLYRTALVSAGYAVVAVEDGLAALKFAERTIPAAIVLDLGLPRVDGRDVQRELAAHEETRDVPIIVVTAQTEDVDERSFDVVLYKPIPPDDLVSAVRTCIQRGKRGRLTGARSPE